MASPEITLTHPDEPLFDGADATRRDLADYLEAVADRMICVLSGWPLSVIRVRAGRRPFMQENVPDYAPPWITAVSMRAESSHREVRYALCEDKPTLAWFASQRASEYHVTLGTAGHLDRPSCLVLDIDPPAATVSRSTDCPYSEGAIGLVVTAECHHSVGQRMPRHMDVPRQRDSTRLPCLGTALRYLVVPAVSTISPDSLQESPFRYPDDGRDSRRSRLRPEEDPWKS